MAMKDKSKLSGLPRSFKHAVSGIITSIRDERNMKIHCVALVVVIVAGFVLKVTRIEWLILLLCVGGVVSLELVNTAVERTIDLYCEESYHPLAKLAKDAAAGAVLWMSLIAAVIGLLIFMPYVMK